MRYELYYWPTNQGRGEFVRLALEDAGADYVDVARRRGKAGLGAMMKLMGSARVVRAPFAPPFLKAGKVRVRFANAFLQFSGSRRPKLALGFVLRNSKPFVDPSWKHVVSSIATGGVPFSF